MRKYIIPLIICLLTASAPTFAAYTPAAPPNGSVQVNTNGKTTGLDVTGHAGQYITSDGAIARWGNPAALIDPRSYGAMCLGPNYTGGVGGSANGIYVITSGSGLNNGTYTSVPLTGGSGSGALATVVVSGGVVTSVTATTAGSGYKLRDQLSAAVANIGGAGTSFTSQVATLNSNKTPTYPGFDDTQGFQNAFAAAQNTGQGVMVPNGCWVTTLYPPQGTNMVANGFAVTYGFNMLGGTADAMPVLYEICAGGTCPTYVIKLPANPNSAFVGFEINGAANYGSSTANTYGIGTDQNSGGGATKSWIYNMSFKDLKVGFGTPNGSTMFAISQNSDYSTNTYGMYGNFSDLYSVGDTFASSNTGMVLYGGAGEVRISNGRFEYNSVGVEVRDYGGVTLDNNQFDNNCHTGLLLSSTSNQVSVNGGIFQNNGQKGFGCSGTWVSGQEADITLSRTSTNPLYLSMSNVVFGGYGGAQPKYLVEATTAGANNEYVDMQGGSTKPGYVTDPFNWSNGSPVHVVVDTQDQPKQGNLINGRMASQAAGLPLSQPGTLTAYGDQVTYYSFYTPSTQYPALINTDLNGSLTSLSTTTTAFGFDCDIVDLNIFPTSNPTQTGNGLVSWLPSAADPTYGAPSTVDAAHLAITKQCRTAGLTWLATPSTYKVLGQSASCVQTGTWANDSRYGGAIGVTSNTNGSTLTCAITTNGGPIYLDYQMVENDGGTFTYAVDGGSTTSVPTNGGNVFSYPVAAHHSVGGIRIPVAAGSHSVVINVTSATSASNNVYFEALLTPPGKAFLGGGPTVYYGGQLRTLNDATYPLAVAAYNVAESTDARQLQADGLAVNFVDVQNYVNATTDMTGGPAANVPNGTGYQHLRDAFEGQMQFLPQPRASGLLDPRNYGAVCNAIYADGRTYTPGSVGTVTMTAGSNVIAIGGYTFSSADVGKSIAMNAGGGGTAGVALGTIVSVNTGANTATLSVTPTVSTTSGYAVFGHDDTAGFVAAATAAASGIGGVSVPDACAVRELALPNFVTLQGAAKETNYSYNFIHPSMFILATGFSEDSANYGINITNYNQVALSGFQIRGAVFPLNSSNSGFANERLACVGTDSGTQSVRAGISLDHMSLTNCFHGLGSRVGLSSNSGHIFFESYFSEYSANGVGIYGGLSDGAEFGDVFTSNFDGGAYWGGGGGYATTAMRLIGVRFEENGYGIYCDGCSGNHLDGTEFQFNAGYNIVLNGQWDNFWMTGGFFEYNLGDNTHSSVELLGFGNYGHPNLSMSNVQTTEGAYLLDYNATAGSVNPRVEYLGGILKVNTALIKTTTGTPDVFIATPVNLPPYYGGAGYTALTINSTQQVGIGTSSARAGVALDLGANSTTANSSLLLPVGTTGARPGTGINGMLRYNSTTNAIEGYVNGGWGGIGGGSAVSIKTANYTVLATDNNTTFTNTGAGGSVTFTLPTAAASLNYCFINDQTTTIVVLATGSNTIRNGSVVTTANGNLTDGAAKGSRVCIQGLNSTEWYVNSITSSWTVN
jgi:hypothetical protein